MSLQSLCIFSSFFLYSSTFLSYSSFFFFNDTATTEIYTLSLHDALPIFRVAIGLVVPVHRPLVIPIRPIAWAAVSLDRKSTRLNSSHQIISYAVFCLKKKKKISQDHFDINRYAERQSPYMA